jgi:hypothetical protein
MNPMLEKSCMKSWKVEGFHIRYKSSEERSWLCFLTSFVRDSIKFFKKKEKTLKEGFGQKMDTLRRCAQLQICRIQSLCNRAVRF